MPGVAALERAQHARVADSIPVDLCSRREAGVESLGRLFGRKHADVFREPGVERLHEIARANRACQLEARDLTERVHARIGATGSRNSHVPPFNRRRAPFRAPPGPIVRSPGAGIRRSRCRRRQMILNVRMRSVRSEFVGGSGLMFGFDG